MDPQRQPLFLNTFASLIEAFTDFLVVSIHTILRSRVLYPPNIFITTRKYNLPVAQLRHPKVCTWILNACSAIRTQLLEGVVDRIFVVIYTQDAKVVERWVFDIGGFPVVPRDEALTEFEYLGGGKGASIVDVEEQLRAIVGRLAYHGERMEPLPENCTYTVAVGLKKMADPPPDPSQLWIASVPEVGTGEENDDLPGEDPQGFRGIYIGDVEAEQFIFRAQVEMRNQP